MSVDVALARIAAPAPPAAPPQPSPPSLVEVPDVTNDDEATAMSLIAHVGLKPVMAPARRGRDWLVEGERPPAGTMVVAGSRVVLQAVRAVKVPQLRGLRVGDARSELERLRLVARPDSDGAERRVTDQSPAAETIVAKGTDVALTTTAPPASLVDGLLSSFDDWRVRLSPGGWGAVIGTVLVASGILLRRILRRKVESSPSPPPSSPPPGPTSPPIDVRWHAQPDLSPLVWMRLASRADSGDSRRLAPEWRVEADDGIALLRAATPETGVSNVDD
jgi:hypothetical protein